MNGPLNGVRVLDFTRVLAGPHATLTLADLGADVIKVEPPAGDVTRFQSPRRNGLAGYFVQQNVGKRCISIDLAQPAGVALALQLAEHSDVIVENYRPGVMSRLGLDYEAVATVNPTIVYCSISGYGQDGPWASRRAYAPVVGAETGFTKSQGDQRGGHYQNDRHSHADAYTALEASTAICAALFDRQRTGRGDYIDVSMAETMLYVNEHVNNDLWDGDDDPEWIRSFGNEHHPVVQVANGDWAVIATHPAMKGSFELLAAGMNRLDIVDDPRFATPGLRKQHLDELVVIITEFAATMPDVGALEAAFAAHRGPAGAIAVGHLRSVAEVVDTDWADERVAIRSVDDRSGGAIRIPNAPWHLANHPDVGADARGPRYRGEDNAAVLMDVLGMSAAEVDELARQGVTSDHLPRS